MRLVHLSKPEQRNCRSPPIHNTTANKGRYRRNLFNFYDLTLFSIKSQFLEPYLIPNFKCNLILDYKLCDVCYIFDKISLFLSI